MLLSQKFSKHFTVSLRLGLSFSGLFLFFLYYSKSLYIFISISSFFLSFFLPLLPPSLPSHGSLGYFEMGIQALNYAILELTMQLRLSLMLHQSPCLSLLSTRIIGVGFHAQLAFSMLKGSRAIFVFHPLVQNSQTRVLLKHSSELILASTLSSLSWEASSKPREGVVLN